jgi:hypothetical protein
MDLLTSAAAAAGSSSSHEEGNHHYFSAPQDLQELRSFIASQIQELLGEEETTLIDFCVKHVVEEKSVASLEEELQVVLEEDAPAFVESLKMKVMGMK